MPSYDIRYLNDDGTLRAKVATECDTDMHAKVMAHAMVAAGTKRIEVWDGSTLVYARPQHHRNGIDTAARENVA